MSGRVASFLKPVKSADCAEWWIHDLGPEEDLVSSIFPPPFDEFARIPNALDDTGQIQRSVATRLFSNLAILTLPEEKCLCAIEALGERSMAPAAGLGPLRGQEYRLYRAEFRDLSQWLTRPVSAREPNDCAVSIVWPESRAWMIRAERSRSALFVAGSKYLLQGIIFGDGGGEIMRLTHEDQLWQAHGSPSRYFGSQFPSFYKPVGNAKPAAWWIGQPYERGCVSTLLPPLFEDYVRIRMVAHEGEGSIEPRAAAHLFAELDRFTQPDDECLCGIWVGFRTKLKPMTCAFLAPLPDKHWPSRLLEYLRGTERLRARRITEQQDGYWLYKARFGDLREWLLNPTGVGEPSGYTPNILWPRHRAWMLSVPYNQSTLFLGGSRSLVESVLNARDLDAVRTSPSEKRW